jgi:hypothetical protein
MRSDELVVEASAIREPPHQVIELEGLHRPRG